MNLTDKLARSKHPEDIDFLIYQPTDALDPLVKITSNESLLVQPCWTLANDWEGQRYADYILANPHYDGIYVRGTVADMLSAAAQQLDDKYKLVIRAGHRPVQVQKRILADCANEFKNNHPGISDVEALRHARIYISDPSITIPPHVCGAAVDVEVVNSKTGKLLDFGTKMNSDNKKSYLHYPNLTKQQKSNRNMLLSIMLDTGFASFEAEWWHYSYGDQTWAWFYGKTKSLYTPVDI